MPTNQLRHQQRAGSVSDRSLSAPTNLHPSLSVRQRVLFTIVLQLQPRYRCCVQNGRGACNEGRFARVTSLRTKGACKPRSDARTCIFVAAANRWQLEPAERREGRSLQKAISAPQLDRPPRRAAGVSRPLRYPSNSPDAFSSKAIAGGGVAATETGASRPPLTAKMMRSINTPGNFQAFPAVFAAVAAVPLVVRRPVF